MTRLENHETPEERNRLAEGIFSDNAVGDFKGFKRKFRGKHKRGGKGPKIDSIEAVEALGNLQASFANLQAMFEIPAQFRDEVAGASEKLMKGRTSAYDLKQQPEETVDIYVRRIGNYIEGKYCEQLNTSDAKTDAFFYATAYMKYYRHFSGNFRK